MCVYVFVSFFVTKIYHEPLNKCLTFSAESNNSTIDYLGKSTYLNTEVNLKTQKSHNSIYFAHVDLKCNWRSGGRSEIKNKICIEASDYPDSQASLHTGSALDLTQTPEPITWKRTL